MPSYYLSNNRRRKAVWLNRKDADFIQGHPDPLFLLSLNTWAFEFSLACSCLATANQEQVGTDVPETEF